eukprot:363725-Chlamydomonas_euryale.AAC.5
MPCASRSYIFFLPLFIHLTFGAAACDALRRHTTRSCGVLHVTRSDAEAAVLAAGCAGTSGRMQKQLCCAAGRCAATSGRMQKQLCRAPGCAGTSGRMQKQLCCAAGCCAATSGRMQMRLCRAAGCCAATSGRMQMRLCCAAGCCAATSGRMQMRLCRAAGCCAATSGRMQMRLCRAAGCAAAAVGCGCWLSCLCWLCYCCFVVICSLPGWLGWERHRRWRRVARSGACFVTAPCRRSTCPNQACPRLGPTSATPDPKSECWDDIQTCRKGLACMQHAIKRVRTQKSRR